MEELIRKVLFTLDTIEVKGRENIDRMLGCMQVLEKVADALAHNRETLQNMQTGVKATSNTNNNTIPLSKSEEGALTK